MAITKTLPSGEFKGALIGRTYYDRFSPMIRYSVKSVRWHTRKRQEVPYLRVPMIDPIDFAFDRVLWKAQTLKRKIGLGRRGLDGDNQDPTPRLIGLEYDEGYRILRTLHQRMFDLRLHLQGGGEMPTRYELIALLFEGL